MAGGRALTGRGWAAVGLALAVVVGLTLVAGGWTWLWSWLPWSTASQLERVTRERDGWRRAAEGYRTAYELTLARAEATHRIEAEAAAAQVEIREVFRTITEKVPVYVSVESDAHCQLPAGFVRLHDAAAVGTVPDAVPDPAGEPHDAPAGVALSAASATIVGNYEVCHAARRQLMDLQAWIRTQQALDEGG